MGDLGDGGVVGDDRFDFVPAKAQTEKSNNSIRLAF